MFAALKSALSVLVGAACLLSGAAQAQFIIAHRGASADAPENTLPAMKRAIELKADAIEVDLQLTGDLHFVLMNDDKVNRTTDGRGKVIEMSLSEIRALNASAGFTGGQFPITAVPTLEEALDLPRADTWLILELKDTSPGLAEDKLVEILKQRQPEKLILKSFDYEQLERLRAALPQYPQLYVMFGTYPGLGITLAEGLTLHDPTEEPVEWLQWHRTAISARLVKLAHQRGKKVIAWGVDEDPDIVAMIELGVDGIETDHPDRARELWQANPPPSR